MKLDCCSMNLCVKHSKAFRDAIVLLASLVNGLVALPAEPGSGCWEQTNERPGKN